MFHPLFLLGPLGALAGLLAAFIFYRQVMREPLGTGAHGPEEEQAQAATSAHLQLSATIMGAVFVALLMLYFADMREAVVAPAFLLGGFCAAAARFLATRAALAASARTALAAQESGLLAAHNLAFRGAAAAGLALSSLGLLFCVLAYTGLSLLMTGASPRETSILLVCFGLGASVHALLVGLEGGRWSGAPRRGCDLYDSYGSSIFAATALGVAAVASISPTDSVAQNHIAVLPIAISGWAMMVSVLGILFTRTGPEPTPADLVWSMQRAILMSAAGLAAGSLGLCYELTKGVQLPNPSGWTGLWGSLCLGLTAGLLISKMFARLATHRSQPVDGITEAAKTGTGALLIEGLAAGLLSTGPTVATIFLGATGAFTLCGGFLNISLGLFGVALASLGMVSIQGITLTVDAYAEICSSVFEQGRQAGPEPAQRQVCEQLGAVGHLSAAAGRGLAAASAAFTAMALLTTYGEVLKTRLVKAATGETTFLVWGQTSIDEVKARAAGYAEVMTWYNVNLLNPLMLFGVMVGATLTFVLSALTLRALVRASNPTGLRALLAIPASLVLAIPLLMGLAFGPAAAVGVMLGSLVAGLLLAVTMSNTGAAWRGEELCYDSGQETTGLSESLAASFQDAGAPALQTMIKLIALACVVLVGLTVKFAPVVGAFLGFF